MRHLFPRSREPRKDRTFPSFLHPIKKPFFGRLRHNLGAYSRCRYMFLTLAILQPHMRIGGTSNLFVLFPLECFRTLHFLSCSLRSSQENVLIASMARLSLKGEMGSLWY